MLRNSYTQIYGGGGFLVGKDNEYFKIFFM